MASFSAALVHCQVNHISFWHSTTFSLSSCTFAFFPLRVPKICLLAVAVNSFLRGRKVLMVMGTTSLVSIISTILQKSSPHDLAHVPKNPYSFQILV